MIRRNPTPLWLSRPSRFAALSPRGGRAGLLLLALLLLATLLVFATPAPPAVSHDPRQRADDQTDIVLYEAIVDAVRHGGSYYPVTADALRSGNYPLRPFVTFRLPTLAMVQALLPTWAITALLYGLAALTGLAWYHRLAPAFARPPPRTLSLALHRRGDWLPSAALGLAAILIRETALPYVLLMGGFALLEGRRREVLGWTLAAAMLAVALAFHAHAVAAVVHPLDPASPGWAGMLGFGFFVRTMAISTALGIAPMWLAAPLVGLSLFGWAAWRDPLGLRMLALLCGYAGILGVFGRVDTFYWGLLVAPASLVGLAFAPDGIRDLAAAALDSRRITVRRVQP